MSFQLVIAEKPSVARSIAAVIGATEKQNGYWQGGGYLVSWCIGHLVSFAEAGQYDEKYCKWKYEDLPILPQPWQFIVPDEKKQQFEIVRALLNRPDVDSVTAATDAGREGELIFRFRLPNGRLHKTCEAALDFQHGGCRYPGGLCKPAPGFGLRCAVPIGPLPCKSRLAGGHQRHAVFFPDVWTHIEHRARHVAHAGAVGTA